MSTASSTSQVPKAVWGGVTAVLMALAALLTHLAQAPHAPPVPDAPRNSVVEAQQKREPTTDPQEIRLRLVEDRQARDATAYGDRSAVIEARLSICEQEVRDVNARLLSLRPGKAREDFEGKSDAWLLPSNATLVDVQKRRPLREAIPVQWR